MSNDPTSLDALTRVLTGLSEYTILHAEEVADELIVSVIATALSASCPACGEFSTRVKALREQRVADVPHSGRRVRLSVVKRSFRCVGLGCERRSFTQHTDQLTARRRTTTRCRELIGKAGKDRSTASVAAEYGVSWSTAWNAVRTVAERELAQVPRRVPAVIGVDETRFWWREPGLRVLRGRVGLGWFGGGG